MRLTTETLNFNPAGSYFRGKSGIVLEKKPNWFSRPVMGMLGWQWRDYEDCKEY